MKSASKQELMATMRAASVGSLDAVPTAEPVYTDEAGGWGAAPDGQGGVVARRLGADLEDRYELIGKLDEGGMGRIVLASDRALCRTVAIKELRAELSKRPDAVARFRSEAQIVAQLEHPGIIPVYAAEQHRSGLPAFSMKYIRGQSLSDYIDKCVMGCRRREDPNRALSRASRLEIFVKICEAIAYAHDRGVVHRDLKPDNVMIGAFGEVYVMDWGIAKLVGRSVGGDAVVRSVPPGSVEEAAEERAITSDTAGTGTVVGAVIGTATHMAPEQALGDVDAVGPAADQYALGMILFELVSLKEPRPFAGDLQAILDQAKRNENAPLRHHYERRIPPALVAIIETALATKIEDRYPSVEDLAEDVRRFSRGEEVSVRPDSALQRAGRFMSTYPALVLGAVLVFMVLGGFVVVESLLETVETQRLSQRKAEQIAELSSYVAEAAQDVDNSGQRVQRLLTGLAAQTTAWIDAPVEGGVEGTTNASERVATATNVGGWHHAEAFDREVAPAGTFASKRYGRPISFEHGAYLVGAGGDSASAVKSLLHLQRVDDTMRSMLASSVDPRYENTRETLQLEVLRGETALLQYAYVALEDGLMLNYPGLGGFTDDYDPRKRPWYVRGRESQGTSFGEPYNDVTGSGILLPCNVPLYDADGKLVGVAGADVRLSDIATALRMDVTVQPRARPEPRPPLPGWRHSALVDGKGRTLIQTDERLEGRAGDLNGNRSIERPLYDDETVLTAIASRRASGIVSRRDELIVYQRLPAIGMYLVVRVDRRVYDGRESATTF